jgi:hypothetical protein
VGRGSDERTHIVYKRSVVDLIRELIGNPSFKDSMSYAPQRLWTSAARTHRVYGDMRTGNWWWRRQVGTTASDRIVDSQNCTDLTSRPTRDDCAHHSLVRQNPDD